MEKNLSLFLAPAARGRSKSQERVKIGYRTNLLDIDGN